jgi:hypothetical protein
VFYLEAIATMRRPNFKNQKEHTCPISPLTALPSALRIAALNASLPTPKPE